MALNVDISLFTTIQPLTVLVDFGAISGRRHIADKAALSIPASGRETRILMNSWLL